MDYSEDKPSNLKPIRGGKDVLKEIFKARLPEKQCLHCGAPMSHITPLKSRNVMMCKGCMQSYYALAGTIFTGMHFAPENLWSVMKRLCMNPITANDVMFEFGCSYTTALNTLDKIRELMKTVVDELTFSGTKPVEADETGQNTGNKGMGRHFGFKKGRGSRRTTSLLLLIERGAGGIAKLFIIQTQGAESIIQVIKDNIPKGTTFYTDEWAPYKQLPKIKNYDYKHFFCKHKEMKYLEDSASTNNCESFFSNYKRKISGTYTSISYHKLDLYNAEFCFRYNFRDDPDLGFQRLLDALPPLSEHYKFKKAQ